MERLQIDEEQDAVAFAQAAAARAQRRSQMAGLVAQRVGASLALCSRSDPALAASDTVLTARVDVTDASAVDRFAADAFDRFGHVDLWINNAGLLEPIAPLRDVEGPALRRHLDTNVVGMHRVNRAVLPSMRARKAGLVVHVSSGLGRVLIPFTGLYAASKFAVEALAETYRMELKPTGVDVSIVQPGLGCGFTAMMPSGIGTRTRVVAERVGLREAAALVTGGEATGDGSVSGSVPLTAAWIRLDNGRETLHVDLGRGTLRADAPGNLRLGEATDDFGRLMEQSNPDFATDPVLSQMKRDVLEAMRNFDFHLLEVQFNRDSQGELVTAMRLHGRGRTGARLPVNLNLTVTGANRAVNAYLYARMGVLSNVKLKGGF